VDVLDASISPTREEETGAGWFSHLFGYNVARDPTIPNYASNGVDIPMNQDRTVTLWDKYGLNLGVAASIADPTQNTAPAQNQTWYSTIWQGTRATAKFIFCPIFTTCPDPLPPGGIKLTDLTSGAGKALGDGLKSALGPIMPILVLLVVAIVAINFMLSRVGVKP
jgi:hypothetical protein